MSRSEQFPGRLLPENIALHHIAMRPHFQQVSGIGLSMPKLKENEIKTMNNKNKNKMKFWRKPRWVLMRKIKWDLVKGGMGGWMREGRNVGRTIADERVDAKGSRIVEFVYEVRCVPRHIRIRLWTMMFDEKTQSVARFGFWRLTSNGVTSWKLKLPLFLSDIFNSINHYTLWINLLTTKSIWNILKWKAHILNK